MMKMKECFLNTEYHKVFIALKYHRPEVPSPKLPTAPPPLTVCLSVSPLYKFLPTITQGFTLLVPLELI